MRGHDFTRITEVENRNVLNTYSMKRPDPYYFEAIKMTSQA